MFLEQATQVSHLKDEFWALNTILEIPKFEQFARTMEVLLECTCQAPSSFSDNCMMTWVTDCAHEQTHFYSVLGSSDYRATVECENRASSTFAVFTHGSSERVCARANPLHFDGSLERQVCAQANTLFSATFKKLS